jgi:hypothetical protein
MRFRKGDDEIKQRYSFNLLKLVSRMSSAEADLDISEELMLQIPMPSVKQLLESELFVGFSLDKEYVGGMAAPFSKYNFPVRLGAEVCLQEDEKKVPVLKLEESACNIESCKFKALIGCHPFPVFVQMVSGLNTEKGLIDCVPYAEKGVIFPPKFERADPSKSVAPSVVPAPSYVPSTQSVGNLSDSLQSLQLSSDDTTALPEGWMCLFDISSNRFYYQNNITKQTQWEHPKAAKSIPQSGAAGSIWPAHIQMLHTPEGRVFFTNHQTKSTSWQAPPEVVAYHYSSHL